MDVGPPRAGHFRLRAHVDLTDARRPGDWASDAVDHPAVRPVKDQLRGKDFTG